jgi:hypothetical protein
MSYTDIIGQVISVDLSLVNWFYAWRDPGLVKIFLAVTLLGKWWVAAIIVLAVAIIFYFKDRINCKEESKNASV